MKKTYAELKDKSVKELEKETQMLREELAKMKMENSVNPPKNTNILRIKKKRLAVLLTVLTQKKSVTE